MNSITATYPGFQALPKGIKQMLVVSESLFFDDAKAPPKAPDRQPQRDVRVLTRAGWLSPFAAPSPIAAWNR